MKSLKNSQNISFIHCCWFNAKLSIYSPHIFLMCINIAFDYLQWCTLWDRYIFTIINSLVTYILTYAKILFLTYLSQTVPKWSCHSNIASTTVHYAKFGTWLQGTCNFVFLSRQTGLSIKIIKKKPLCCFLLLVFDKSWKKIANQASHATWTAANLIQLTLSAFGFF